MRREEAGPEDRVKKSKGRLKLLYLEICYEVRATDELSFARLHLTICRGERGFRDVLPRVRGNAKFNLVAAESADARKTVRFDFVAPRAETFASSFFARGDRRSAATIRGRERR